MEKINIKILITVALIMNFLFTFESNKVIAEVNGRLITGKVIYTDDKSPVTNGNVKIFRFLKASESADILEKAAIQTNGVFKIFYPSVQGTDGIKLMAYPNDIDNIQNPFEPKIMDFEVAMESPGKGYDLIIEVERANDKAQGLNNLYLKQNYPNPFNPSTLISFNLQKASNISLKVYDMSGANVATLIDNKNFLKGENNIHFNAGNLPSGIYVYTLNADGFTENRKMILLK